MQKSDEKVVTDRRSFLKLSGAGVATGCAAVSAKQTEATEAKPARGLYRETEHVKRYYELARG
jgi:hypothetical protein